jgi:hypothetical protein
MQVDALYFDYLSLSTVSIIETRRFGAFTLHGMPMVGTLFLAGIPCLALKVATSKNSKFNLHQIDTADGQMMMCSN